MMSPVLLPILLACLGQVPPPDAGATASSAIRVEARALLSAEADDLVKLADRLGREGRKVEADAVRAGVRRPAGGDGPIRFVPLPEVVAGPGEGLANLPVRAAAAWPREAASIRAKAAKRLFVLAGRAAAPGVRRFSLVDRLLRDVLDRDSDHAEARRLLGFVPYKGGWATPHAADLLGKGNVPHPNFGWVPSDWVPHLDRGELPGAFSAGGKPREWLPAAQANALRRDWARGWQIRSAPHFEIQTNVTLEEAVAFGRRLEGLHDLFFSEFADLIDPQRLPLARRYANPAQKPVVPAKKFAVAYFAEKAEYVDYFRKTFGQDESISLGYYLPPSDAKRLRNVKPRSYFFRDEENAIASHATLYHEASHQLLFETSESRIRPDRPNYWIWEGLGTYFETVEPQPDGSILVGGLVGPRLEQAKALAAAGKLAPLAEFSALDRADFGRLEGDTVYRNYAQAMALTAYLLHGEGGRYREAFVDFAAEAYAGKVGRASLADRLGESSEALDRGLKRYLDPTP